MFRLGRTEGIDELIDKAEHIYFDAFKFVESEMIEYFTYKYNEKKLNEYKPLDLSEYEKKINEKDVQ